MKGFASGRETVRMLVSCIGLGGPRRQLVALSDRLRDGRRQRVILRPEVRLDRRNRVPGKEALLGIVEKLAKRFRIAQRIGFDRFPDC